MTPQQLGTLVVKRRKAAGFVSQDALAERLGTSRRTVSRWETGETVAEGRYRRDLVALLGIDAAAFEQASTKTRRSVQIEEALEALADRVAAVEAQLGALQRR